MFAAFWRWLTGGKTRQIVKLSDIPTWTEMFNENELELAETVLGEDEREKAEVDFDINDKVSLYNGDITCLEVDGIVRSTSSELNANDGVSGAISRAAGGKLMNELRLLSPCSPGNAKTTSGYSLPAKYIVHTVAPKQKDAQTLAKCYQKSLEEMQKNQIKSLAFCCIGTGLGGFPNDKAARVALRTVRRWLEDLKREMKLNQIDRIVFCVYSEEDEVLYSYCMQIFFPCLLGQAAGLENGLEIGSQVLYSRMLTSFEGSISMTGSDSVERTLEPLPGFIELTSDQPDMITLDDDPNTMRAVMPCGHVIGPQSMTDYCKDIIFKRGQYKFRCPDPTCDKEWEYFLVRHVGCFTEAEKRTIEKKIANNYLQKEKGIQKCPGCQTWCSRLPNTGNCVRCPICTASRGKKFDFCWVCLNEWKGFLTCGRAGCDGKDKRIEILATCNTKKINYCNECPEIRGCPRCGILIAHRSKCGHMECSNCPGYGFCFICLKEKINGRWQCKPYLRPCVLAPRQTSLPGTM